MKKKRIKKFLVSYWFQTNESNGYGHMVFIVKKHTPKLSVEEAIKYIKEENPQNKSIVILGVSEVE